LDAFDDQKDKQAILSKTGVDEADVSRKAFLVMEEIIRHYNYFQVQTIDSFINAILSGCAFKLELSSDFRIKNDPREYLSASFDELIDSANRDPEIKEQFHAFLRNYLYLENRKSWFPKNDILEIMDILMSNRNSRGLALRKFKKELSDIKAKRQSIKKAMLKLHDDLPEGASGTYWRKFEDDFNDAVELNSIDDFFNPFSKSGFPAKKDAKIPAKQTDLWQGIKDQIKELYEWEAFSRFDPYIDIFLGVEENFKKACRRDDIMFLAQLNARAQELFTFGSISVPELYYRLATQLSHFLIDEFQDTSVLQWKNIFPMAEEALATGGSLFYVGDKKQAIFRWRGGEVELMNYLKIQLAAFNVHSEPLSRNFRSQKEIVLFNNAVFSPENIRRALCEVRSHKKSFIDLREEDVEEICQIFANSNQTFKEKYTKGYVQVNPVDIDDPDEKEDFIKDEVFSRVDSLLKRFAPGDIAILCRSNEDVEKVTAWLIERKFPVESEKTLNIRENSLIKELISLLTFLDSPIDDLAFATFIMGEIFTKASGISNEKIRRFLFKAGSGARHRAKPYLYRSFRNEFPQAWEGFIEEFFKTVGFVPLYELVITVCRKFEVLDRFPQSVGFVMKFLEVVKEQEEDNQSIGRFLEYFADELAENLFVHTASSDSIRVMTVHKAKGLEFPVVIIPFFEINIRIGSGTGSKASFVIDAKNEYLSLTSLKQDYIKFSPDLESRYRKEYTKTLIDELNNLYVAATRAKYELYIFVSDKLSREFNIASLLIPQDKRVCGCASPYEQKNEKKQDEIILAASKYRDWIGFLKDEFEGISVAAGERVLAGNVLHSALSGIGNLAREDAKKSVLRSMDTAKRQYPFYKDWEHAQKLLEELIEHKKAKDFFNVPDGEVFCEKEMVDSLGNAKRADRLIVKDEEVIIIDYKSSRLQGDSHQEQLRDYAKILGSIYSKKAVKKFLVYLDDMAVEEVA
jgi:ATP-dependent exoDNAse (exonuclease V) beta subunit